MHDAAGVFRVLYVAKFDDAVYVLHCFRSLPNRRNHDDRFESRRFLADPCERHYCLDRSCFGADRGTRP
ncbi:MAG: type II toxin-antitoxin system RelE/ParE family toxin [Bradyrhizobium sp.]